MERPSRSDVHLSMEEETKRADETREYFDGIAPKRHTKPMRSEYSNLYEDSLRSSDEIPELTKFQELEGHSEKVIGKGSEPVEEYVETEYYKDLNCVGKQHHTTGTGFIKMENSSGKQFHLDPDTDIPNNHQEPCRGNPATNEWIPAAETVIAASGKPNRSDN
ncbi:hypothetical protein H6P81_006771 [Aristolochia fimbriata]|uniref:Maternal effect embryo arrest 59 n=1 Tax=Aristolochia fimbriata TaxID=158543 RepID=A0AAV7F1P2_ARIFI|nr:hypothetical protein H6P81_006771 [Aristolochia fimbriata]